MEQDRQMILQGIKPYFTSFFNEKCGYYSYQHGREDFQEGCGQPAALMAIAFVMGNYNESDGAPELLGFDCPFSDSDILYACSTPHLERILRANKDDFADGNPVEVVVNAKGEIEADISKYILENVYGVNISGDSLQQIRFSRGKESLEEFWKRERHHFI